MCVVGLQVSHFVFFRHRRSDTAPREAAIRTPHVSCGPFDPREKQRDLFDSRMKSKHEGRPNTLFEIPGDMDPKMTYTEHPN